MLLYLTQKKLYEYMLYAFGRIVQTRCDSIFDNHRHEKDPAP